MSRFFVKGIIVAEPYERTFKNDTKTKTIQVEERLDKMILYHNIEFSGKNIELVPDIPLIGAEVFITGTMIGKKRENSTVPFENLRGDSLSIIGIPTDE